MKEEIFNSLDKKSTFLNLSNKNIKDITALKEFKTLTTLVLNSNEIEDISALKDLSNLQSLYLKDNQISSIEYKTLSSLQKLRRLELSNNNITTFPKVLLDLDMQIFWKDNNNQGITLEGNPLNISPEIIQNGKQAINEYLKSEQIVTDEVKVLLVGDGSSGKTSLLNRILYDKYNPKEDQTNGINIQSKEFKTDNKNITLNFWDFGGQDKFFSTHNFFLSRRSLYILLVDSRKDSKVEYWLDYIKTIADSSPVIVVMNKIDQNPDFDLNRRTLLESHKNIKGFYKISCETKQGLEKLYQKILLVAIKDVEMSQITLPKGWYQVRENLKILRKKKDFISYEQFQDICEKEEIIDEKKQNLLLNIYNDLGELITYKHDNNQHILLNPDWIVEALYKIISYKEIKNGRLYYKNLDDILTNYSSRKYKFIMNTMKEFQGCFEFEEGKYILPDLLTPNSGDNVIKLETQLNKDDINSLQVEFKYKLLPSSLITKCIVNNHQKIKNDMMWKTGVVLQNSSENSFAIIESHPTKKTIKIQVWGKEKDDFFRILIDNIKELNKNFKDLKYKILIPLEEDNNGEMHYATYKVLEGYLRNNKNIYFDGELEKSFDVTKLLTGIEKKSNKQILQKNIFSYENIQTIFNANKTNDIHSQYNLNYLQYEKEKLEKKAHFTQIKEIEKKEEEIRAILDFEHNREQESKLKQIQMQNIKFFDTQVNTFTDNINIILGKNGYGKSYFLKLIVSILQNNLSASEKFLSNNHASVSCRIKQKDKIETILRKSSSFYKSIGKVPILSIPDARYVNKSKTEISPSNAYNLREEASEYFLREEAFEPSIQGLLYDIGFKYLENPQSELFILIENVFERLGDSSFKIVNVENIENGTGSIKIYVQTEESQEILPIQKASQGTLSILAIFGLIYFYLKGLNPQNKSDKILERHSIVCIDELDAHLHPSWQKKIINLLRQNFPNVQFFLTAHSPLVVAGCYENEVNVLRKEEYSYILDNIDEHFIGKDINTLYEEYFKIDKQDDTYLYYKTRSKFKTISEKDKFYINKLKF